ncbi:MAG: hypothetical protein ABIR67_01545 [Gaiellaceae bacterium]
MIFREAELPLTLLVVDHRHDRRHEAHDRRLARIRIGFGPTPVGGFA